MKCDSCVYKVRYLGSGAPDDYSTQYCSRGHWEGGPEEEVIEGDPWADCQDYQKTPPSGVEKKHEKLVIAPVVTVDEFDSDYPVVIIHSHINLMGKMILNKTEAALLLIELWNFCFPKGEDSKLEFAPVTCHAHPRIEMRLSNFKKDEIGYFAECSLHNIDLNSIESSFFLDEERAIEIKNLMETFLLKVTLSKNT